MASMRNWLHRLDEQKDSVTAEQKSHAEKPDSPNDRVVVVHCKAGKGRSGTIATSYLISQEGWKKEDALQRFTDRRMRVGFGAGVSIPSQLRYVDYVDRWTNQMNKVYVERPVEILEVHVWGMRDGVKVAVEGYVDQGKKQKCIHMFHRRERTVIESGNTTPSKQMNKETGNTNKTTSLPLSAATWAPSPVTSQPDVSSEAELTRRSTTSPSGIVSAAIFRPEKPLIVPGSDVNIDFERRSKASYTGFAMVTSVAHVWFNPYFEGGDKEDSGVFETEWDALDGIKGSARKGIRALERLKVVWRYPEPVRDSNGRPISEPKPGEPIFEGHAADWRQKRAENEDEENKPPLPERGISEAALAATATDAGAAIPTIMSPHDKESVQELERQLGLRQQTDASKDVSLAGSEDEGQTADEEGRVAKGKGNGNGDMEGVRSYFQNEQDKG